MPVMNRRDFARATLVGGTLAALSPIVGSAGTTLTGEDLAGGLVPEKKVDKVLDAVQISMKDNKAQIWLRRSRGQCAAVRKPMAHGTQ